MIKVTLYKNGEVIEMVYTQNTTLQQIADEHGINSKITPVYVNGERETDLETEIGEYGVDELNITSVFKVTNGR